MSAERLNPMFEIQGRLPDGKPQQSITLSFVVDALRRWWKVALPLGLILAAAAVSTVLVLSEPTYEAACWLQVEDDKPYVAFPDRQGSRRYVETQKQILRSPMVLGPVISDPRIAQLPEIAEADDPFQELRETLLVETMGDSEILRVAFKGPRPQNAADIVNAVTEAYLTLHLERDNLRQQQVVKMLKEKQGSEYKNLEARRDRYRELCESLTGDDPFVSEKKVIQNDPLGDLQNKLAGIEVERMFLEAQASVLEEEIKAEKIDVPAVLLERAVDDNPEIQTLAATVSAKRARLGEYETKTAKGKDDPKYQDLSREVEEDEKTLTAMRNEAAQKLMTSIKASMLNERKDALTALRANIKEYVRMETSLREKCTVKEQDRTAAAGRSVDLEFERTELERAEKVYNLITDRLERMQTEMNAPAQVSLFRPAAVPAAPLPTHLVPKMALVGLAMFCLPFVLAVVWERLVGRVSDTAQFEQASRLAVIGEIARLPMRTGVFQGAASGRTSQGIALFEESIDSLRTYLVLSESLRDLRVLAVTSSVNSEGKTSVAVQLAVSIARACGQPTLLIDGDMRSPDVHAKLDIPLEPGLADVLSKQCSLDEALVTDWSNYLHLLPAGRLQCSPHKLLGNGAVHPLFEAVRQRYRYVIVDTPPILAASEALVLAKAADAAIICAMRDVSRVDQIRRTESRLTAAGTPMVGVVLNAVPTSRYAYRYGSYAYSRD
ncbi:MAG: polysaccharide biosynthesis tyrosine autokinase [Pirellulales bacterium]|nr:polysaccharide biosynthesis tyrosine autokinase [Pirellulales bacterium]